jgi:hypothetical protein
MHFSKHLIPTPEGSGKLFGRDGPDDPIIYQRQAISSVTLWNKKKAAEAISGRQDKVLEQLDAVVD